MNQTIEQQIIEAMRVLPEDKQKEVLAYAEQIGKDENAAQSENGKKPKKRKLLATIEAIMKELPPDAFKGYPTDGSLNHDHYLYGAPKREQK